MEELALPTRAIQLSGKVLSTGEAASPELCEAKAVHRAHSSRRLFKATPMTPCVCQEQQLETGLSNKRLKHTLEFYSTAVVRPSRGCSIPRCRTRRRLCGREPPGPDPHTTVTTRRLLTRRESSGVPVPRGFTRRCRREGEPNFNWQRCFAEAQISSHGARRIKRCHKSKWRKLKNMHRVVGVEEAFCKIRF